MGHCAGLLAGFWLPPAASNLAGPVDWLFFYIFYISLFFFVVIVALMLFFAWHYRRSKVDLANVPSTPTHNTPLEVAWTVIPVILVLSMFIMGFRQYINMETPPEGAYTIQVTAKQWSWMFTYPNGAVTNSLHLPVNRPVRLLMTSQDVVHGFYIAAFRIQRDVLPDRIDATWFTPTRLTKPGQPYWLECTQYCGNAHSSMRSTVVVQTPAAFRKWVKGAANIFIDPVTHKPLPLHEVGERIYHTFGCISCHSVNGSKGNGPTWKNLAGSRVALSNGPTQTANFHYLRECVLYPGKQLVKGFPNIMPDFYDRFAGPLHKKGRKLDAVIWYINMQSKLHNKASEPPVSDYPTAATPAKGRKLKHKLLMKTKP